MQKEENIASLIQHPRAIKKKNKNNSLRMQALKLVDETGPPPGFEENFDNVEQSVIISVYFRGKFLKNATVSFNRKKVRFTNAGKLISSIPNIRKTAIKEIEKVLSSNLSNNESLLCSEGSSEFVCKIPEPKIAAIVFKTTALRAEIFINPKLFSLAKRPVFKIYPSTSGFSYLANNFITTSGMFGTAGEFVGQRSNTSSLNSMNYLAYKNHRMQLDANLTHRVANDAQSTSTLDISNMSYGTVFGKHQVRAGVLGTQGGDFIPSMSLLGLSLTNYGFFYDPTLDHGTLIPIFLTSDANVDIFRGSSLVFSKRYTAGSHYLDTSVLEGGAYNITIKIHYPDGRVITLNRFFVKHGGLPDNGSINYQTDLGVLTKSDFEGDDISTRQLTVPHFTNKPMFDFKGSRRLTANSNITAMVQSDFIRLMASLNGEFVYGYITLNSGVVVAPHNTYGARLALSYVWQNLSFNWHIRKLNSSEKSMVNYDDPLNLTAGYETSLGIGYSLGRNYFSFRYWLSKSAVDENNYQYNARYRRSLYTGESGSLSAELSGTRSYEQSSVSINLIFNFTVPNVRALNGQVQVATEKNYVHHNPGLAQRRTTTNMQLNKSWYFGEEEQKEIDTGLNYNQGDGNRIFGVNTEYSNNQQQLGRFSFNYTMPGNMGGESSNNNFVTYLGQTRLSIVNAGNQFSWMPSKGEDNAVLVDVQAPMDVPYQVYVDGVSLARGIANHDILVPMDPYLTHEISIETRGVGSYKYDKSLHRVYLYEGNVQRLSWILSKQYILFAQVVDPHNKGLNDLLIENTGDFEQTGTNGYFQTNLINSIKTLTFMSVDNETCLVHLPKKIDIKNGLAVLDKPLVCHLIKAKPQQKKHTS